MPPPKFSYATASRRRLALLVQSLLVAAVIGTSDPLPAATSGVAAGKTTFAGSIASVASSPTDATGRLHRAYISRSTLLSSELQAEMPFEVALTMRNFEELEARLAHSEIIDPAEMQARYLPLAKDYERVRQWLESSGFAVQPARSNHLAVFARGPVAKVAQSLGVTFARVTTSDGEFTSAITPPSVPAALAGTIRGIHGLQPHQRWHVRPHVVYPRAGTTFSNGFTPAQIAQAYNAAGLGLNGTGQTIAIYGVAFPSTSDLTAFWRTAGVTVSAANIQMVNVAGGPGNNPSDAALQEATLDVEWASSLAPGAIIRMYAASETDPVADDELIQEILADLPTHPTLHQLTISFGADENAADRDYMAIEAQYMATLVGSGVTVFAASGDNGALDNEKATIQTGFPASMPDVTAVGGTTLALDSSSNILSEMAWGNLNNQGSTGGSGGGVSVVFSRPAWQNVAGAPAGTMRLVPDVAAIADPHTGGLIVYGGSSGVAGGTSLASPIWAAWCAMINQSRASAGKAPLGALNPRIYPLQGTAAFHDIVSGGNSVFQAGVGYDLCTGLGSPNVAALLAATTSDSFAPAIEISSGSRFTTVGQSATFYVVATSTPAPSFQWQRLPAGSSTWVNLTDGGNFAGTSTYALLLNSVPASMNGDQYRCVISNSLGSVTSTPATLTVSATGVSTVAGWPGWSGYADGQGSAGRFNYTGSVRTAPDGTIYVADASNNTIRKISLAGVVTTVAGAAGVAGSADGSTSVARFNGPAGVAIDAAGIIYVADAMNYTVRKISANGVVSTLAGTAGVQGHADGTGPNASFYDPENLTLDSAGNIYVADGKGNEVRKVTPAGVVTTLAGAPQSGTADGTGSAARFNLLAGITVDAAGNVYVGDYLNNAVRKITPSGVVTTLAGLPGTTNAGFVNGTGSAARFAGPVGLAADAFGNLYVSDSFNNAVRAITPAGVVTTLAGSAAESTDGPLNVARFNQPADVAIDASGVIYIADSTNCTIRRITLAPQIVSAPQSQTVAAGGSATLSATFSGTGPFSYQWDKDGAPIAGATGASYTLTNASSASAGTYTVTVSSPTGTTTSAAAFVTLGSGTPTGTSRLANLSVRTFAGTGDQTLTVGFVLSGSPSKTVLIRGVGPGLIQFNIPGTIPDPVLTVLGPASSTTVAASNNNWNSSDRATMDALGAFPLTPGSTDAAVVVPLASSSYSAQVTDASGTTGIALAEIYDTAPGTGARLINVSARAQVGTQDGVLIAGFEIWGTAPKTVLIRGIGPGLIPFSVSNTLADPRLDLYDEHNVLVQSNDNWGGAQALTDAFNQTGAFRLTDPNSKDAALVVTLPPGIYTAQVSGVNNTTGVALAEVYEMP